MKAIDLKTTLTKIKNASSHIEVIRIMTSLGVVVAYFGDRVEMVKQANPHEPGPTRTASHRGPDVYGKYSLEVLKGVAEQILISAWASL